MNFEKNLLSETASLREALQRLNEGILGVVLLVDHRQRVLGLLTDGDVRRALLNHVTLEDSALEASTREFCAGSEANSREENLALLSEKIRHLPILNKKGQLVDLLSWAQLWKVPVMEPSLGGNELKYVVDCIESNWISSQGHYIPRFEKAFANFLGSEHALTCSSGTTAIQLALAALRIGPGDEVIVPNLTFGACGNAVIHSGATPVFVDVSPKHWTLDPAAVCRALSPRTKAIMPVHLYGHPCDMGILEKIAQENKLYIIEDCAESLGSRYKGQTLGTIGHVGCFSFFSNKVITTGEGGMVSTQDPALAKRLAFLRDHGMNPQKRYWHEEPGFNFRMTNLQAAIGLAQIEQIKKFILKRKEIAKTYRRLLSGIEGITHPPEMSWAENVFWLYSILLAPELDRDAIQMALQREGVETRPLFYPLAQQPAFCTRSRVSPDGTPVSNEISKRGLSLPSSNRIQEAEMAHVAKALKKVLKHQREVSAPQA